MLFDGGHGLQYFPNKLWSDRQLAAGRLFAKGIHVAPSDFFRHCRAVPRRSGPGPDKNHRHRSLPGHYTLGAEGTARRVAETCEEVFPTLAAAYDYYDDFRTIHVLVFDNSDQLGNGWANYYSNTMAIWATSLDFELRGSHDWIKNVVTHELTHIITLNKARKKWPFQFALLSVSRFDSNPDITFQFPLYHLNTPRGWTEGIAQYGAHKFGYDAWDSHRDMLLRMAVLEDDLLSWEEMGTVWDRMGKFYGEFVYNQGYAMMVYLHAQYGAEKVDELTHQVGSMSFDPAIRRVLGHFRGSVLCGVGRLLGRELRSSRIRDPCTGFFQGTPLDEVNEGRARVPSRIVARRQKTAVSHQ